MITADLATIIERLAAEFAVLVRSLAPGATVRRCSFLFRSIVPPPGQLGNFLLTAGRAKDNALYRGSYQRARQVYRPWKFVVRANGGRARASVTVERLHLCGFGKIQL